MAGALLPEGAPALVHLGDHFPGGHDSPLPTGLVFSFASEMPLTLTLMFTSVEEGTQEDFVEDYAGNLPAPVRQRIWANWSGQKALLTSTAGRTRPELSLMISLAAALAVQTNGWVVVSQELVYSLEPGFYRGEEFARATPAPKWGAHS